MLYHLTISQNIHKLFHPSHPETHPDQYHVACSQHLEPKKRESAEILGRILSTDCEYRVIISHVETPSCFYVLFKDNAVESIEEKINSVVEINSNDVLQEEDFLNKT
jgi:hypothetical protein